MVWNITPHETAPVTHPCWSFTPERSIVPYAVPDALQCCVTLLCLEAFVFRLPGRLRVGDRHARGPISVPAKLVGPNSACRDCNCSGRSNRQKLASALVHA